MFSRRSTSKNIDISERLKVRTTGTNQQKQSKNEQALKILKPFDGGGGEKGWRKGSDFVCIWILFSHAYIVYE